MLRKLIVIGCFLSFLAATLRLAPLLPTSVAVVQFPDVKKATEAVRDIINTGVGIRTYIIEARLTSFIQKLAECIELLDSKFMYATNQFGASSRKWPEKDTLFIKLQGRSSSSSPLLDYHAFYSRTFANVSIRNLQDRQAHCRETRRDRVRACQDERGR